MRIRHRIWLISQRNPYATIISITILLLVTVIAIVGGDDAVYSSGFWILVSLAYFFYNQARKSEIDRELRKMNIYDLESELGYSHIGEQ